MFPQNAAEDRTLMSSEEVHEQMHYDSDYDEQQEADEYVQNHEPESEENDYVNVKDVHEEDSGNQMEVDEMV